MKGTPGKPNPAKPGMQIPVSINFEEHGDEVEADARKPARTEDKPRGLYIKNWMLDEYGYTEECPGCAANKAGRSEHAEAAYSRMPTAD